MASTTTTTRTVLYPNPPPTVNTLNRHQRSRLMKSNQKLGQMLGTTPYLLESPELPITLLPVGGSAKFSRKSGHERSASMHSASSSVSSLGSDSSQTSPSTSHTSVLSSNGRSDMLSLPHPSFSDSKHSRSKEAPTPLFLRLNTVPVSPSDKRFASSVPSTPSTATTRTATIRSIPSTPSTPTYDQSEVRRKRMAKLARYLGETIPPHLVSAVPRQLSKQSPKPSTAPAKKRRSMSVDGTDWVSELGFSQHKPAVSYCPKPQPQARLTSWIGEWNRSDMQEVQRQLRALR